MNGVRLGLNSVVFCGSYCEVCVDGYVVEVVIGVVVELVIVGDEL